MAPSKVFPIRATQEERAKWQAAADVAGLSFNAWARRSLNEQVDLDAAVSEPTFQPTQDLSAKFRPDPRR